MDSFKEIRKIVERNVKSDERMLATVEYNANVVGVRQVTISIGMHDLATVSDRDYIYFRIIKDLINYGYSVSGRGALLLRLNDWSQDMRLKEIRCSMDKVNLNGITGELNKGIHIDGEIKKVK